MSQRDLSRHQQSIVKRYYKNLDTIVANRLQEAVTELYLAESDKKRASMWKKVKTQLDKTPADPDLVLYDDNGTLRRFKTIVLDEVEQLVHHLFGGTIGARSYQVFDQLRMLILQSDFVVLSDADIGPMTNQQDT